MTHWALRIAGLIFFVGGILSLAIKDANGHPIGIPSNIIPWFGWIIIILGFVFLLMSAFKGE